ncbi:hypothetical protein C9374_009446 [Naegleria lovaniensis]|uniref:MaoC-like domain-containing protein n=1 Tax=Naegleria lovaniensis TaxID=51637 RepID=A0AA88H3B0_NAELO|nr:uncharacterized protein C9374_009446 [Naegleria lovaniensis]KAG2392869.1 hypothetical protein C9374_009446 [Naegleria lovaniensis]
MSSPSKPTQGDSKSVIPPGTTFRHRVTLPTRWSDEDNQKVLNNAIYLTLFEEARTDYFGPNTLNLLDPETLTYPFVLLKCDLRCIAPGKGFKQCDVYIKTSQVGTSSFTQLYRVSWEGTVWCEAEAVIVYYNFAKKTKENLPDHWRESITKYENYQYHPVVSSVQTNKQLPLRVGMYAEISKKYTHEHVKKFAELSEDYNPIHLNAEFASKTRFKKPIVHGQLLTSLISGLLGAHLPGDGTIYMEQTYKYKLPLLVGERVKARVEIEHIDLQRKIVTLKTDCYKCEDLSSVGGSSITSSTGKETLIMQGQAKVMVPAEVLEEGHKTSKL